MSSMVAIAAACWKRGQGCDEIQRTSTMRLYGTNSTAVKRTRTTWTASYWLQSGIKKRRECGGW